MSASISVQYAARVAAGKIEPDSAQEAVVADLARLEKRIAEHRLARKSSSLGWLFGPRARAAEHIRGLYIFGEVGRGKTMLMDLFFAASPVVRKRRVHFHEFMADVHERIYALRQKAKLGETNGEDPIALTAAAIAQETWLLCFDEFHVTDIADAMILGRLFKRLFELGVVVVATSNVPPSELYKDGLNRALFLPFIALIEEHMEIVPLRARADFRLEKLAGAPVWYVPADRVADAALDEAWRRLTAGHVGEPQDLVVKGRTVHVPRATMGVARFSFHDLCQQPLAAADYLKVAHEFHTVMIDRIQVMDYERPRRGQALHHFDRYPLRQRDQARCLGRGRARRALSRERRFRGLRIHPNRFAPHRDALASLSGPAARPRPWGRVGVDRRAGGDLSNGLHCGSSGAYSGFSPAAFTIDGQRRISSARNTA